MVYVLDIEGKPLMSMLRSGDVWEMRVCLGADALRERCSMTLEEQIIVSAYTGYLMCDVSNVHKYIEKKLGRPVWTHEMATENFFCTISEATGGLLELVQSFLERVYLK